MLTTHNTQLYGGAKGLSTSNFSSSFVNKWLVANKNLNSDSINTPYCINSSKSLLSNKFQFDGSPNFALPIYINYVNLKVIN